MSDHQLDADAFYYGGYMGSTLDEYERIRDAIMFAELSSCAKGDARVFMEAYCGQFTSSQRIVIDRMIALNTGKGALTLRELANRLGYAWDVTESTEETCESEIVYDTDYMKNTKSWF